MRRLRYIIVLWFVGILAGAAAAGESRPGPRVAATVDFLDYAMDDAADAEEHYPLERYARRLAALAESGVGKIYLRVNACGLALYPSKVTWQYGVEDNYHWRLERQARRLIETMKRWNPLTETIRVGHELGLEVWAWESVWDDGGADGAYAPKSAFPELTAKNGSYFAMDPFFRKRPDYYLWRKPDPEDAHRDIEAANRANRGRVIGKIIVRSSEKRPVGTFAREDLVILGSRDNERFFRYDGPVTMTHSLSADGRPALVLDGLRLEADYVQLFFTAPRAKSNYVYAHRRPRGQHEVFDDQGKPLHTVWTWFANPRPEGASLDFVDTGAAWDYANRGLGFVTGEPEPFIGDGRYLLGVCEFLVPEVMEHKLARFAELAEYPFDGFMLNLRGHNMINSSADYGYNPEVREAFKARHGRDIWTETFDRDAWLALRAEGFDRFLAGCKERTGGRPLFVAVTDNRGPVPAGRSYGMAWYVRKLGLPWNYDAWFANGWVDGVTMLTDFFPEHLTGRTVNGRPATVGVLREMLSADPGTLKDDLERWRADGRIDEIELYEALAITRNAKHLQTLRAFSDGK